MLAHLRGWTSQARGVKNKTLTLGNFWPHPNVHKKGTVSKIGNPGASVTPGVVAGIDAYTVGGGWVCGYIPWVVVDEVPTKLSGPVGSPDRG
jgi:hypothetical protein